MRIYALSSPRCLMEINALITPEAAAKALRVEAGAEALAAEAACGAAGCAAQAVAGEEAFDEAWVTAADKIADALVEILKSS
jgi:hypothetical protein